MIQLLLFLGQYDDLGTREVKYLPSQMRGEYCTSRIAKSSYKSKKQHLSSKLY